MSITTRAPLVLAMLTAATAAAAQAAPRFPLHTLDNGHVQAAVTDAIGGRLLSFNLAGKPNFLKVDPAAGDPDAKVDANTDNVGYLGHEIWAGPQKQWWT